MIRMAKLGNIANIFSGGTPSRRQSAYWGGNIPWIKTAQVQNSIIRESDVDEWITEKGFKNSSAKMVPKGSILMAMYGQGKTRGQVAILGIDATVNQACAAIIVKDNADSNYVFQQLLFRYESIRNISNTGSQKNLNSALIKSISFPLPDLMIQKTIAILLSTWDLAIEKAERLIAAKEKNYSCLLSNLISNDRHQRGHIRDFVSEVSMRNNGVASDLVFSVTNNRGFVLPEDQFERRVASSDLSNYKIVTRGQYAYNPSRINVGSIARLDGWDKGILSPMYIVFEIDEKKVNSDFFLHWLESHEAKERIRKSAQGSVRETVSFTDFGAISFPMLSIAEQTKIASILNTTQSEIDLLKKQLAAFRKQKRGLMQKLLTGQWRVGLGC